MKDLFNMIQQQSKVSLHFCHYKFSRWNLHNQYCHYFYFIPTIIMLSQKYVHKGIVTDKTYIHIKTTVLHCTSFLFGIFWTEKQGKGNKKFPNLVAKEHSISGRHYVENLLCCVILSRKFLLSFHFLLPH